MKNIFITIIGIAIFFSCSKKNDQAFEYPDVSGISANVKIERLDKTIQNLSSIEETDSFLQKNKVFEKVFLRSDEYPNRNYVVQHFYEMINDPNFDSLFMEVDRVYGDVDVNELKTQFETAFKYIKYYYPDFKIPKIKMVVSGILHDLHVSDSLVIIGLDYYLGKGAKYRPMDMPNYLKKRYQKEYIVPQVIMLMSTQYNANNRSDQTALADMVFYGKSYFFTKQTLPGISDTLLTGYTTEEHNEIHKFEHVIWAGLLENEALYETSHTIKEKFLGERPKTYEIGENCPGRIGRWVGYQIVQEYMTKSPDVKLPDLMANPDAQQIFNDSKYRPSP